MEASIKYVTTADDVSIAYTARGSGPVLLSLSPGLGIAIAEEHTIPSLENTAAISAQIYTYVRFDWRGCGLSDRNVTDFSIEAMLRDLEAVSDAVAPDAFMMFAPGNASPIALSYAAKHPDRVSRIVSWMGWARGAETRTPAMDALRALATTDWRLFTESYYGALDSWTHPHETSLWAAMSRAAVTPETHMRFEECALSWDISATLPLVKAPVLVLHPRQHAYFDADVARRLAARLPDATMVLVNGASVLTVNEEAMPPMARFLMAGHPEIAERTRPHQRGHMAVVLFLDIVDSTGLTERLGDVAFRRRASALDDVMRSAITTAGGRTVEGKLLGDGVLAIFTAASDAITAAQRCIDAGAAQSLQLHAGIHAGDVIREGDNVYGGAVNTAARIASSSAPDEILLSDTVRSLARTSAGVAFEDRGEHALKGIEEPLRLYAVRPAGA